MSYQISWLSVLPKLALSGLVFSLALSHDAEAQVVRNRMVGPNSIKISPQAPTQINRAQPRATPVLIKKDLNVRESPSSPRLSPYSSNIKKVKSHNMEPNVLTFPTRTQTLQKARKLPTRSPVKVIPKRPSGNFRR